jgi:hypothetical protein
MTLARRWPTLAATAAAVTATAVAAGLAGCAAPAEAGGFAQRMLSAVVVPAGSQRLPPRLDPAFLRTSAGHMVQNGPSVSPSRLYRLPMPVAAAITFVQAHLPPGEVNPGWGKYFFGPGNSITEQYVYASERNVPPGIDTGVLQYNVVPGPAGTSVLQVSAQVIWYPPRPAAEDFAAASFRAVTVTGPPGAGRPVARTFSSRRVIGELVGLLDSLHVSTANLRDCGLLGGDGSALELLPAPGHQPPVHAQWGLCNDYWISLGASSEPPLQGPNAALNALIARLLRAPCRPG